MVRPLTILEPVYLPEILERANAPGLLNGFEELDRYRSQFDPAAALARIGWSAEMVLETAEDLLARGSGMDPTPELHDLVRLVHSSHWDSVRRQVANGNGLPHCRRDVLVVLRGPGTGRSRPAPRSR